MKKIFALILATLMIVSCFSIIPLTASAEGWDGSTATAPAAGSGTKDDPYQIASAENLQWLANTCNASAGQLGLMDVFKGVYFKQTADIDLNGQKVPIIGNYVGTLAKDLVKGTVTTTDSRDMKYNVFGGNYDGQGYSISNGVSTAISGAYWPMGLFGVIRGATIQNVNLTDITLTNQGGANGVAGLLVGYAMGETENVWYTDNGVYQKYQAPTSYSSDFNKIINCSVSGTIDENIALFATAGIVAAGSSLTIEGCTANVNITTNANILYVGGVAGYLDNYCVVKNCVNNGDISITSEAETDAAGIVGWIQRNVWIENCVNTGDITVSAIGKESAFGGIAGDTHSDPNVAGSIVIENCFNSGKLNMTASVSPTLCYGGILGCYCYLPANSETNVFEINNCYNLNDANTLTSSGSLRVGAILGSHWGNGSSKGGFTLNNCYSVAVDNGSATFGGDYDGAGIDSYKNTYTDYDFTYWGTLFLQKENTAIPASALVKTVNCGILTDAPDISDATVKLNALKAASGYSAAEAIANRDWEITRLTTKIAPAGSGTEEDPYLIACAENLVWMGETIISLNNEKNVATNPFKDTYFLQVADIDLGGKAIRSIGYYNSDELPDTYSVFGGNYNGQGFAIKNGYVIESNTAHGANLYWAGGLFGMIYGATIENVNLKNMVTVSKNIGGVLVGRAARVKDGAADESFNIIRNCSTDADCYVRLTAANTTNNYHPVTNYRAGGIVGYAECVTVENCTNNATIYVTGGNSPAGGIAGTVGFGTRIYNCVNNGTIVLNSCLASIACETGMGGIAGAIAPAAVGLVDGKAGNVTIDSCANYGHLEYVGTAKRSCAVYWGGILGGVSNPHYLGSYVVKNCYNNQDANVVGYANLYRNATGNDFRFGSIVGVTYGNNANGGYTLIQDCAGVEVYPVKVSGYFNVGGVVIVNNNTAGKNPDGGYGATVKIGSTVYKANADAATVKAASIFSEAEIAGKITTAGITGASGKFVDPNGAVVGDLAVQEHNNDATVRFVALIDKNVTAAMFDIIASYKIGDNTIYSKVNHFDCNVVYEAINAGGKLVDAPDGKYFALVTINNIPADRGDVTFYVTPSVVDSTSKTLKGATLVYTYDKSDLENLSAINVGGAAPVIGYNPNAVGAVNVAEMLQKKLASMGADAGLAENGNIVFDIDAEAVGAGKWSIASSDAGIYVVSDTAHGLIAAYEYMLPKLGLADDLTEAIKSAEGTYAVDKAENGELRVLYHNILTYSLQLGYTVLDRADLMLLTYQALEPDVIGLQEAGKGGANFAESADFAELREWLDLNYDKYQAANNSGNPIFVKKGTFTVVANGYSQNNGGYGSQYVVLKTAGGKTFAVTNSHFEASSIYGGNETVADQARYENGQKLIALIKDIQTTHKCSVISGGDFNADLYTDPVGLELTMGSVAAGFTYKNLVKYSTLDANTQAEYLEDDYGYAYKVVDEKNVYLTDVAATAQNAGLLDAVRHIALKYVDRKTTHSIKVPQGGDTRYETVTSLGTGSKDAIDHVFYKAYADSTITFNEYKVVDDCFALTSSDHAPHYVDIVLN